MMASKNSCDNCQKPLDKTCHVMGAIAYCPESHDAYIFSLLMAKGEEVPVFSLHSKMTGFLVYLKEQGALLTVAEERFLVEYAARS